MDYLTKCNAAAGKVNELIAAGKRADANDTLMCEAERIAKECGERYADTKQAIFFFVAA